MSQRAVFIDRDGTLNEMVYDPEHGLLDSPKRPDQLNAKPGAREFLAGVRSMGFRAIVVTNQPGVAKGALTEDQVHEMNRALYDLCSTEGVAWDDLYFCPYHPDGGPQARPEYVRVSPWRKPEPGMLLAAAKEHDLDLENSWMVGDGLTDIQAGNAAGCRTILLTTLKVDIIEKFMSLEGAEPDFVVGGLHEALEIIKGG